MSLNSSWASMIPSVVKDQRYRTENIGGFHRMEHAMDVDAKLTAKSPSAQPATSIKSTPTEGHDEYYSQTRKDKGDAADDKVKQESMSPLSRATSNKPKLPRTSIFTGLQGIFNPKNPKNVPVSGDIHPVHNNTSSLAEKNISTPRRHPARTPKEFYARQSEDEAKKMATPKANSTIADRVTKPTSQKSSSHKSKKKKSQSDKASLEKLKQKFNAADPFSLDLGKEARAFKARTQQQQFDNILADCPENHDVHKRGVSKTALLKASRSFGHGKMKPMDGKWQLQGMNCALHNHQLIGSSWMLSRECSLEGPQGGILADSMGLGKTIQCIVLLQWKKELKKHAGDTIKKIDVYKANEGRDAIIYNGLDVILTTFKEVTKSMLWPDNDSDGELSGLDTCINESTKGAGALHQLHFYRIVIDEGVSNLSTFQYNSEIAYSYIAAFGQKSQDKDKSRLERFEGHPQMDLNWHTVYEPSGRRTMEDRILNRPLVWLPPAKSKAISVRFNIAENILYRAVEDKFQELRKQKFADDDLRKPMSYRFPQISYLRVIFEEHELAEIQEKIQGLDPVLYERIGSWIRGERAKVVAEYNLSSEEATKMCDLCLEDPEDLREIPGCNHLFCDFCLNNNQNFELSGTCKCPACDEPYNPSELEKLQEKREKTQKLPKKKFMRGKDARKYIPTTQNSVWLDQYDRGKIELRPSSKLEAVMEQGDMSQKTRIESVELFETKPTIKVLVSGLKCGGLGLNLAFANKVISVDMWWNPWAEKQAFGRVRRIGQTKETFFSRAIVADSIEDRLASLQLKKLRINSIAMQDKLTKEEEASLLKRVRSDTTPDLDAVDHNGGLVYALVGTDPGLDSNAVTLKEPFEETSGESSEESSEDDLMEDYIDEIGMFVDAEA
ncbi:hypothetical protein SBOR_8311 [Sclerotinia borealis F-4128]|uniref:Uncharacterized protein n=1 Tax=Sclerotinia borealis (strain F-4128) TaxID=1432307 RepID=W9C3K1_SCLBF|nr:hypothetical protein SBOR_8311 [Sclerotinia borealis F-4128]